MLQSYKQQWQQRCMHKRLSSFSDTPDPSAYCPQGHDLHN